MAGSAGMRARSMLFTLFGDYVRHYGGTIWVGSLIALMAELGFTAHAVRAAVSRMARQGWLAPTRVGRASYYALTPRGQDRIAEAAGRIFKLYPEAWDRHWRLLVVPSGGTARPQQAAMRRELGWIGFARVGPGQYITANDVLGRLASVEERYGLVGRIETFVARHEGGARTPRWPRAPGTSAPSTPPTRHFSRPGGRGWMRAAPRPSGCQTPRRSRKSRVSCTSFGSSCSSIPVFPRSCCRRAGAGSTPARCSPRTTISWRRGRCAASRRITGRLRGARPTCRTAAGPRGATRSDLRRRPASCSISLRRSGPPGARCLPRGTVRPWSRRTRRLPRTARTRRGC